VIGIVLAAWAAVALVEYSLAMGRTVASAPAVAAPPRTAEPEVVGAEVAGPEVAPEPAQATVTVGEDTEESEFAAVADAPLTEAEPEAAGEGEPEPEPVAEVVSEPEPDLEPELVEEPVEPEPAPEAEPVEEPASEASEAEVAEPAPADAWPQTEADAAADEPDPEPDPELPGDVAPPVVAPEPEAAPRRRFWQRRAPEREQEPPLPELPRHVRVLHDQRPEDPEVAAEPDAGSSDPWEHEAALPPEPVGVADVTPALPPEEIAVPWEAPPEADATTELPEGEPDGVEPEPEPELTDDLGLPSSREPQPHLRRGRR
jgi:hypothetical protein